METLRVLHIGLSSFPGGVENFVMNYYKNIDRDNVQFDFICEEKELAFENEIKKLGGQIIYLPSSKRKPAQYFIQLIRILRRNNYIAVHCNMLSAANILPIIAARIARVNKVISHSHNSSIPTGKLRCFLHNTNKSIVKYLSTHYFACSEKASNFLFGTNVKDVILINNAIDSQKFVYQPSLRNNLRYEYNILDKFVIGHVGRFAEQKNHKFLIDIFFEITKIKPNSILVLVGDGELMESIKLKIEKLNLMDKVIFLGCIKNVHEIYQLFDVFLLPSLFEGLPLVGIEAQAAGLPTFVSENVSKEIKITNLVEFITLNKHPQIIASEVIEKCQGLERRDMIKEIQQSGYDVRIEASKLLTYYF